MPAALIHSPQKNICSKTLPKDDREENQRETMYKINRKLGFLLISILVVLVIILITIEEETELKTIEITEDIKLYFNESVDKLVDLHLFYSIRSRKCAGEVLGVIVVTSYFGNVETRSAMRRAFGEEDLRRLGLRRVFLLGLKKDDRFVKQAAVEDEARRFGDIIQGNFQEAYRNLTYKHLMGLKWASENCPSAKYVIKMDDDIVINVRKVAEFLRTTKLPKGNLLAGYVLQDMVPKRDPANKWFVTKEEYPHDHFPTFLSGWFYITNPGTAKKLVALSQHCSYFWIDDAFVTGVLAQLLKAWHFNLNRYFTVHPEFLRCCVHDVREHGYECEFLAGPNGGDNNLFYEFNSAMEVCAGGNRCVKRPKSINDTCVAERKINMGRGSSVIETYHLFK